MGNLGSSPVTACFPEKGHPLVGAPSFCKPVCAEPVSMMVSNSSMTEYMLGYLIRFRKAYFSGIGRRLMKRSAVTALLPKM
jgi:hypothetical protein